jgi:hypothetical protein
LLGVAPRTAQRRARRSSPSVPPRLGASRRQLPGRSVHGVRLCTIFQESTKGRKTVIVQEKEFQKPVHHCAPYTGAPSRSARLVLRRAANGYASRHAQGRGFRTVPVDWGWSDRCGHTPCGEARVPFNQYASLAAISGPSRLLSTRNGLGPLTVNTRASQTVGKALSKDPSSPRRSSRIERVTREHSWYGIGAACSSCSPPTWSLVRHRAAHRAGAARWCRMGVA